MDQISSELVADNTTGSMNFKPRWRFHLMGDDFEPGWRWRTAQWVLMCDDSGDDFNLKFKPGWRIVRWVLMGDDRGGDIRSGGLSGPGRPPQMLTR